MKTANARLMYDALGSCMPMTGITPAEAVILGISYMPIVQDWPLYDVVPADDVQRSPLNEKKRLMAKYGKDRVKAAFPGAIPALPEDFDEAKAAVMESIDELADAEPADMTGARHAFDATAKKLANGARVAEVVDA